MALLGNGTTLLFTLQNTTTPRPPPLLTDFTKRTLDYVEISVLVLLFIFGAPINVHVAAKLHGDEVRKRFSRQSLLLKQHLNVSNLLVIFIYVTSRVCILWANQQWNGGTALCKGLHFVNLQSFHLSSNVIVCIAVVRVLECMNASTPKRVRVVLMIAWLAAVLSAVPQLLAWDVTEMSQKGQKQPLRLCSTIWQIERWRTQTRSIGKLESLFHISHHVLIFWLPAAMIAGCYAYIFFDVLRMSNRRLMIDDEANASSSRQFIMTGDTDADGRSRSCSASGRSQGSLISSTQSTSAVAALASRRRHWWRPVLSATTTKLCTTMAILVAVYIACWLPYSLLSLALGYADRQIKVALLCTVRFLKLLTVLNAVANPYFYGMSLPSSREPKVHYADARRRIFCCTVSEDTAADRRCADAEQKARRDQSTV